MFYSESEEERLEDFDGQQVARCVRYLNYTLNMCGHVLNNIEKVFVFFS